MHNMAEKIPVVKKKFKNCGNVKFYDSHCSALVTNCLGMKKDSSNADNKEGYPRRMLLYFTAIDSTIVRTIHASLWSTVK